MKVQQRQWLAGGLLAAVVAYAVVGFYLAPGIVERRVCATLAARTGLDVTIGQVRVNPFLLRAEIDNLAVGPSAGEPAITIDKVVAHGRIADAFRRGAQIHVLDLMAPRMTRETVIGLWRHFPGERDDHDVFLVRQLDVTAGEIFLPGAATPGVRVAIERLSISKLGSDEGRQSAFRFDGTVGSGRLAADGWIDPGSRQLDASLDMADIELADFGAKTLPGTQLRVSSAALGGRAHLVVERGRVELDGGLSLARLVLIATAGDKPVLNAKSVSGESVSVTLAPLTITAERLHVTGPHLRITRDLEGNIPGREWLAPLWQGPRHFFPAVSQIEFSDGQIDVLDFGVSPPARTVASAVNGSIAEHDDSAQLFASGQLAGGDVRLRGSWRPDVAAATGQWNLDAAGVGAAAWSPYLAALSGHAITSGKLSLKVDARAGETGYQIANTLELANVAMIEPAAPGDDNSWPLGIALALLEDADGLVRTSVPLPVFEGSKNSTSISTFVSDALEQFVATIAARPFDVLGQLGGVPAAALGEVVFDAGGAAPSDLARERLGILAAVMQQRPGIGIDVTGRYDPRADRDALARAQVGLHVALATSASAKDRDMRATLDFADTRVVSVLEEFAGKRLPAAQVASLRSKSDGAGNAFYAALFEALVANEPVADRALKNIARFRARAVVSELSAAGVAAERLQLARTVKEGAARAGEVVVPLSVVSKRK